ncbi:capsular biosynthesis protein [Betaproteobacteria bacterium GR16-43]|nr:capsular biosynthesis protein [Betaproteobacteria bacterium GR16-43]
MASPGRRCFLFLQGPTNLLFAKVADRLRARGHEVHRIHVCVGDRIFWRGPGVTEYRGTLADWPAFIADFYDRHGVTEVVLLGEKRDHNKVAIVAGHAKGIRITVTDFGYFRPDWVVVERDGLNGDSHFPRDPEAILQQARGLPPIDRRVRYPHRAVTQAAWDMTFHLSSAVMRRSFPHFRRHSLNHPVVNYLATGWRLARGPIESRRAARVVQAVKRSGPYCIFAMQMEDDYSLRAYSPYPDLDAAMDEALRSFAANAPAHAHLVFKLHPLDPGLKRWRHRIARLAAKHGVAGRAHFIDGGDLDALIAGSHGLVTINSTAGLRSLELRCPTFAMGQTIYRVPGLAFDGTLDDFWMKAPAPDPALVEASLRLMAATLHVRGSFYDAAGIEAAAEGMAYRLHHGRVNQPLAAVLRGEIPRD